MSGVIGSSGTRSGIIGIEQNVLQPSFNAYPSSTQSNIAYNEWVTVAFGSERWDTGGNFASNTFTAPRTGKYQFNVSLYLTDIQDDAAYYGLSLLTSTGGGKSYDLAIFDPTSFDKDASFWYMGGAVLADMGVGDTAYARIYQSGGTGSSTDIQTASNFSGFLVC